MKDLESENTLDDMASIDLDSNGVIMPEKHSKIALIDADTIAYTACFSVETKAEVLSEDLYSDDEFLKLINNPNYDTTTHAVYNTCPKEALAKAEEKIQRILDKTGCAGAELHFSSGRNNFRYSVSSIYKATRTSRPPVGLKKLKLDLAARFKGAIHTKHEADDAVVYLKNKNPDKYILCAVDKDVLNSVEGKNFNYYESNSYSISMKWVHIDERTALTWRFLQTIMGDKTDNVIGLKGLGPVKAAKVLWGCNTHKELWKAVCEAYIAKGRTEDEALMNLNLVDMRLLQDDGNIKLRTHEDLLEE